MQAPQKASRSNRSSHASEASVPSGSPIANIAVIASAGLVMPLAVGDTAVANPATVPSTSADFSTPDTLSQNALNQEIALNQGQGVNPAVSAPIQAGFAANGAYVGAQTGTPAAAIAPLVSQASGQESGARQALFWDENGNWQMNYRTQSPGAAQAVIAQAAQSASQLPPLPEDHAARLAAINSALPEAQQAVVEAQQQLSAFAETRGQGDLAGYGSVLGDRAAEISGQKAAIGSDLLDTRQHIRQLESRLSLVGADLTLPTRVLRQDQSYQEAWQKLEATESQLMDEFSKANLDATLLNQIYVAYQQQQQALERAAYGALNRYIVSAGSQAPTIIYEAPAALDVLQELVVVTHQKNVQQLRMDTIATIEARLQSRQQQLTQDMAEYDQLNQAVASAQSLVAQYEQERNRLLTAEATTAGAASAAGVSSTESWVAAARDLETRLPLGSLGKTLLGVAIAAGGIAIAVYRRKPRQPQTETAAGMLRFMPAWQVPQLAPAAASIEPPALAPQQPAAPQLLSLDDIAPRRSVEPTISDSLVENLMSVVDAQVTDEAFANQGPSLNGPLPDIQMDAAFADVEESPVEYDVTLDVNAVEVKPEPAMLDYEIQHSPLAPVELSLSNIDRFGEQIIRWVIADTNLRLDLPSVESLTPQGEQSLESLVGSLLTSLETLKQPLTPITSAGPLQVQGPKLAEPRLSERRRGLPELKSA